MYKEVNAIATAVLENALKAGNLADPILMDWMQRLIDNPEHVEFRPTGHGWNELDAETRAWWELQFPDERIRRPVQMRTGGMAHLGQVLAMYRAGTTSVQRLQDALIESINSLTEALAMEAVMSEWPDEE